MEAYFAICETISLQIMSALEVGLKLPTGTLVYCGMRDMFCEFATLKRGSYKPYKTVKIAVRYLEAARIIGGGEFTKHIPHSTVVMHTRRQRAAPQSLPDDAHPDAAEGQDQAHVVAHHHHPPPLLGHRRQPRARR